jgi:nucleoside phosphorylase
MMPQPSCYFFVALPCEAKPLIEHFKLKKELSVSAFTIYRGTHITLTVTGLGKSAMAAGVGYTLALCPAVSLPLMLNIGIAGHRDYALGKVFAAHKIIDHDSERSFYPQLVSFPPCATQQITTVSQAQLNYSTDTLYEMEASAFYETAIRFSSSELIHCIKVISDNKENASTQIKPAQVSEWIKKALPIIDNYCQQLSQLANLVQATDITEYTELISQWRFSSHEKMQLQSLLNKRKLIVGDKRLDLTESAPAPATGKDILNLLRNEIDALAFGGF